MTIEEQWADWRSLQKRGLYCRRCRTDGWGYGVDACPNCGCKTLWCDEGAHTTQTTIPTYRQPKEPRYCECGLWKEPTPFHCVCGRWKPSRDALCQTCTDQVAVERVA